MSASRDGSSLWLRAATYLGFVKPEGGASRSRWARVVAVEEDSSRSEMVAGLLVGVLLVVLVASRVFAHPGWFRVVAAVATVALLSNVVRTIAVVAESHRAGRG